MSDIIGNELKRKMKQGDNPINACAILMDLIEKREVELTAARAEIEGLNFALKQASSIYDAVTEHRDRLAKAVGSAILALTVASLRHDQDRGTTDFFKGEISELDEALQSLNQPNDIVKTESKTELINTIKSISAKWRNEGEGYSTSYEPHDIFKICADEIDQALNQPNE